MFEIELISFSVFKQEKIDVEEMVDRMRTMADKLPEENGQIFEEVFIGFLELITVNWFDLKTCDFPLEIG